MTETPQYIYRAWFTYLDGTERRRMETDYFELASLVERMLEIANDNIEKLAEILDSLDEELRMELLTSDLLNALQAFYYFFREIPSELVQERLMLSPASEIASGVVFEEIDLCQLVFVLRDGRPSVLVSDGSNTLATFSGRGAYRDAISYIEEHAC
ncbi:MAG: hypothetical protein QHG99_06890 [Methanomicrobiales archaeon]|nr:hypothetical protein [Methanomicrobiales archaeon]